MNLEQITDSCVKCAKCIPSCTIHEINPDESTSPRGFLDLLAAYKKGELKLDKKLKGVFESCFLCTNCVEVCPTHLRVDNAIEEVRYDIAKKFGIAWYKKILLFFLRHRKILDLVAKMGFVFQSCAFSVQKNTKENLGMRAKFSLPLIKKGRLITSFTKKSFLNSHSDFIDNGGKKSIGFFVGCLSNYFYNETAEAVLSIAKELKINVDLMKSQVCCAAPHFFTGDFNSVEALAQKNLAYFEEKLQNLECIIIPEATCSAMLNVDLEHFFEMIQKPDLAKRAKKIAPKIKLATAYFHEQKELFELLRSKKKQNLSLTYHDPCHARKMQGIFKEPRELLSINFTLKEMSNPNACCGFGGVSMQSDYYDRALKVGLKKAKMIDESKADCVSAECSACRLQISNALVQNQSQAIFKNPLELIAKALKQNP